MTTLNLPETFNFGGTELIEIKHLENTFSITRRAALKYLKVLHIKPMYFGKKIFYSTSTFNRILYVLSKPGSPGFLFPGSDAKNRCDLRKSGDFLIEVTEDILKEASSSQVLAEISAASGRDSSMIKKLLAQSNAQSRKDSKK